MALRLVPYPEDSHSTWYYHPRGIGAKDPGPEKWAVTPLLAMRRDLNGRIPETISTLSSEMLYFQFDVLLGSWS